MTEKMHKFFACMGIMGFGPLMILLTLLIFWEDGFPIFFRQKRVGKDRKPFTVFKFRTMRSEKVTRVGRWLRKTGLDEISQFFNVLKGDMNIVGPRPLTSQDIERMGWTDPSHDQRWSVKPGITGLAQIFAGRSADDSWRMDRIYLSRISSWTDIKIILVSVAMNILGKKAVRKWLTGWKAKTDIKIILVSVAMILLGKNAVRRWLIGRRVKRLLLRFENR